MYFENKIHTLDDINKTIKTVHHDEDPFNKPISNTIVRKLNRLNLIIKIMVEESPKYGIRNVLPDTTYFTKSTLLNSNNIHAFFGSLMVFKNVPGFIEDYNEVHSNSQSRNSIDIMDADLFQTYINSVYSSVISDKPTAGLINLDPHLKHLSSVFENIKKAKEKNTTFPIYIKCHGQYCIIDPVMQSVKKDLKEHDIAALYYLYDSFLEKTNVN